MGRWVTWRAPVDVLWRRSDPAWRREVKGWRCVCAAVSLVHGLAAPVPPSPSPSAFHAVPRRRFRRLRCLRRRCPCDRRRCGRAPSGVVTSGGCGRGRARCGFVRCGFVRRCVAAQGGGPRRGDGAAAECGAGGGADPVVRGAARGAAGGRVAYPRHTRGHRTRRRARRTSAGTSRRPAACLRRSHPRRVSIAPRAERGSVDGLRLPHLPCPARLGSLSWTSGGAPSAAVTMRCRGLVGDGDLATPNNPRHGASQPSA